MAYGWERWQHGFALHFPESLCRNVPERFPSGFSDSVASPGLGLEPEWLNFALSSYPSEMKKSLVGCEREFLERGGGDERFWVQIESLSGFVGGLRLSKVAVVSFGFCMEDAIFKHGARR